MVIQHRKKLSMFTLPKVITSECNLHKIRFHKLQMTVLGLLRNFIQDGILTIKSILAMVLQKLSPSPMAIVVCSLLIKLFTSMHILLNHDLMGEIHKDRAFLSIPNTQEL